MSNSRSKLGSKQFPGRRDCQKARGTCRRLLLPSGRERLWFAPHLFDALQLGGGQLRSPSHLVQVLSFKSRLRRRTPCGSPLVARLLDCPGSGKLSRGISSASRDPRGACNVLAELQCQPWRLFSITMASKKRSVPGPSNSHSVAALGGRDGSRSRKGGLCRRHPRRRRRASRQPAPAPGKKPPCAERALSLALTGYVILCFSVRQTQAVQLLRGASRAPVLSNS